MQIRTLMDCDQDRLDPALPSGLSDLYDGNLQFPAPPTARPFVFANFVSTIDGIVSYEMKGQAGGSTISGSDPADRFIMGLLRASADAIMVGARTVEEAGKQSLWTPEYTYPDAKQLYADYRVNVLHRPECPILVVISGSGNLNLDRAIFRTSAMRTIVITTMEGRDALTKAGAAELPAVEIHALNADGGTLGPMAILQFLHSKYGIERLLHEGGPSLFGQFMAAEAVDELFLTLSPQIAGRTSTSIRPALVQGTQFSPESAPWFQMMSVKQSAEHLYLRYRRALSRSRDLTSTTV